MRKKTPFRLLVLTLLLGFLAGCGGSADVPAADSPVTESPAPSALESAAIPATGTAAPAGTAEPAVSGEEAGAEEDPNGDGYLGGELEKVASAEAPAVSLALMPEASGTVVYKNEKAAVDASHTEDGYIMVAYNEPTEERIKVILQGPTTKYTYNLKSDGSYEVYPLSDGNGTYTVGVYKNITGTKYALAYSTRLDVTLRDEFAPFLLPNQYVNYTPESAVVKKAAELTSGSEDMLAAIAKVYHYVVDNFSYDYERAATVKSGYLPDLDDVLAKQKGICFDYAAVMTAMLRSQGIPCRLVIGNAGSIYHAWISCYSKEEGWLDGIIYFDGYNWKLMDPTFASTGGSNQSVMDFIGNSANYVARYLY